MHLAAKNGHARTVKELASKKKSLINSVDINWNTPLHLAASLGKDSCVKALVKLGAQISARLAVYYLGCKNVEIFYT